MWSKRDIKCLINWINSEYFQSLYNEYNDKEIVDFIDLDTKTIYCEFIGSDRFECGFGYYITGNKIVLENTFTNEIKVIKTFCSIDDLIAGFNNVQYKEILWDYLNTVEWCENNNYLIKKYSFDVLDKFIKLRELIENN